MNKLRVVFFGTPEFAVPSLQKVYEVFDLKAVVTAPDKRGGRGHQLLISEVKKWSISHHVKVFQPEKLKSKVFIDALIKIKADLFVVVAFRMLPEIIWNMPRLGTINLHASLLPKYRGAAPIQRAILNGETETGLTCFRLRQEIDTGDIICQQKVTIEPQDDSGTLYDKLQSAGPDLLVKAIELLDSKDFTPIPQKNQEATPAPKIFPEDAIIQWDKPANTIHNHIRAFAPYPGARTEYDHRMVKILKSKPILTDHNFPCGQWFFDFERKEIKITCKDGYIQVLELQPESKKKLSDQEFLNGLKYK
ncbi:MAG: methionyl-tRNA formyltransferase [Saprospiraceae bacterium]|nr:methionyl-tRNA formyltransferase [Saprospiraceae bacterium]HMW38097.1 methionyl-tRNA formyltransferase [Saprospiraceae bacterium]HMX87136.1 methionyl-tRNA formyltransferase [Saprospiraceae bacterium]HMZ38784.1 methionyl-tRNA formyltransferase [Saprospiraceae bacterium]HNA63195.1 methionyl-tRNA formyltransferase [Saprospiraceae bacterium]